MDYFTRNDHASRPSFRANKKSNCNLQLRLLSSGDIDSRLIDYKHCSKASLVLRDNMCTVRTRVRGVAREGERRRDPGGAEGLVE